MLLSIVMMVKNEERYSHLPTVRAKVATPLKDAKGLIEKALKAAENKGKAVSDKKYD